MMMKHGRGDVRFLIITVPCGVIHTHMMMVVGLQVRRRSVAWGHFVTKSLFITPNFKQSAK
jgi:hypothetical protein